MRILLVVVYTFLFSACSDTAGGEQSQAVSAKTEYRLIRDNLYTDDNGNLYLKSWMREHFETGKRVDVWINLVHCDTCRPVSDDVNVDTELKDFVDTATFHLDSTVTDEGGDFYEDKNHRYFHKWMADGGIIRIVEE